MGPAARCREVHRVYMHGSAAAAVVLRTKVDIKAIAQWRETEWKHTSSVVPLCTTVPSVLSLPCAQQVSSKKGNHAVPVESYLFISADCSALIKSLRASIIRSVSQAGALLLHPLPAVGSSMLRPAQIQSRLHFLESCIGQDRR